MSTFALKLTALVLMLLDHIGYYLVPPLSSPGLYLLLRTLGRGAYPLFLFCFAQGYAHTRSRKKYLLRLYLAGVFMAFFALWADTAFPTESGFGNHNIFVPMLLAGLVISTVETAQNDRKKGLWMAGGIFALQLAYFIIGHMPPFRSLSGDILTGFLPNLAVNEYGITFILLGVAMYFLRDKPGALAAAYLLFCAYQFSEPDSGIQFFMVLALPLILHYNGEKGPGMKWFFYIFYPLHTFWLFYLANFIPV